MSDQETTVTGTPGRYANALFDLAKEQDSVDDVAADLADVGRLLDESADLRRLVRSPVFDEAEQARAMAAIVERAGYRDLTRRFIGVMARNRRLFALRGTIAAFAVLRARDRGEVTARITTAQALTEQQEADLIAAIKAAVGQDVQIQSTVNGDLLGGLVVRLGSRMIDSSLATKLDKIQIAMREA